MKSPSLLVNAKLIHMWTRILATASLCQLIVSLANDETPVASDVRKSTEPSQLSSRPHPYRARRSASYPRTHLVELYYALGARDTSRSSSPSKPVESWIPREEQTFSVSDSADGAASDSRLIVANALASSTVSDSAPDSASLSASDAASDSSRIATFNSAQSAARASALGAASGSGSNSAPGSSSAWLFAQGEAGPSEAVGVWLAGDAADPSAPWAAPFARVVVGAHAKLPVFDPLWERLRRPAAWVVAAARGESNAAMQALRASLLWEPGAAVGLLRAPTTSAPAVAAHPLTRGVLTAPATFTRAPPPPPPRPFTISMAQLASTSFASCCHPGCVVWGADAFLALLLGQEAQRAAGRTATWLRADARAGGGVRCLSQSLVPTGTRLPNGTFTGRVGLVAHGPAHMLSAGLLPAPLWRDRLRFLYPHVQDNLCVAVLRSGSLPFHEQLRGAFDAGTWASLAAAGAAGAAARLLASPGPRHRPRFHPRLVALPDALLRTTYALFVGTFDPRQEPPLGALEALLAAGSVVLSNAFAGRLASFLTAPLTLPDVDTLEGVDRIVARVHGQPAYAELFTSLPADDVAHRLQGKFVATTWLHDMYAAVDAMLRGAPVALQKYASSIQQLASKSNYTRGGYALIHQVRECMVAPAFRAFPVKRDLPLLPLLERSLRLAVEAGLPEYYATLSYPMYRKYRDLSRTLPGSPRAPPGPLALEQAQAAFLLLAAGLAAAACTFAGELWAGRRR